MHRGTACSVISSVLFVLSWSIIAALAANGFSPLPLLLTYCASGSCLALASWGLRRWLAHADRRAEESDDDATCALSSDESSSDDVESGPTKAVAARDCAAPLGRTPRCGSETLQASSTPLASPRSSSASWSNARSATHVVPTTGCRSPFDVAASRSGWAAALAGVPPPLSLLFGACAFCLLPISEAVAATVLPPVLARGARVLLPAPRGRDCSPRKRLDVTGCVALSLAVASLLALAAIPSVKGGAGVHELASGTSNAVRRHLHTRDRFGILFACAHATVGMLARFRPDAARATAPQLADELRTYAGAGWMAALLLPYAGVLSLSSTAREWLMASNADVYAVAAGIDTPTDSSCLRLDVLCAVTFAASLARFAKFLSANAATHLSASATCTLAVVRVPVAWVLPAVVGLPGLTTRGVVCSIAAAASLGFLALDPLAAAGTPVSDLDVPVPIVEQTSSRLSRATFSSSVSSSLLRLASSRSKLRASGSPDSFSDSFQFDLDSLKIGTAATVDSHPILPIVTVGA